MPTVPSWYRSPTPCTEALVADGIPISSFAVDDVPAEFARPREPGVRFAREPVEMGPVTTAVLDDTCGTLVPITRAG